METISRMMAETLTYTAVLETAGEAGKKNGERLLPAIAFFEDSPIEEKYDEYKKSSNREFMNLINEITVFIIRTKVVDDKLLGFEFVLKN